MKSALTFLFLLATSPTILAQTAEQIQDAASRLDEASQLPEPSADQDKETLGLITLTAKSHSIALTVPRNHRIEQPEKLSDTYLKSCKIISNQSVQLMLATAIVAGTFNENNKLKQKLDELKAEYANLFKLLAPARLEFDRRGLKL